MEERYSKGCCRQYKLLVHRQCFIVQQVPVLLVHVPPSSADDSRMQVLYSPNSSLLSEEFEDASSSESEGVTGPGLDNANCLP